MKLSSPIIIVDLELNAQKDPHIVFEDQIIEIGAVYIDKTLDLSSLKTFQTFIKYPQPLTPFITQLTGITQEMISLEGIDELNAFSNFKEWVGSFHKQTKLVGWGSDAFELSQIMKAKGFGLDLRCWDAKAIMEWETGKLGKSLKRSGLRGMMNHWGLEWDNTHGEQHRGVSDSFNTLRLLKRVDERSIQARFLLEELYKLL